MTTLRLGTRGSALALAQSGQVARALEAAHPGLAVELVPLVTRGDRYTGELAAVGGKGLFTAELEQGLADGTLDLAVHSLKDLPVAPPEELVIAAFPKRADPRDALINDGGGSLDSLPRGARVLTGALRRRAQLLALRPDLEVVPVRGNVDTRLRKWEAGEGNAVMLAAAGLDRLGFEALKLDPADVQRLEPLGRGREGANGAAGMLPAPGQGTLALQVRRGSEAEGICRALDDPATARAARAERAVVRAFGGDCTLPLAAWARADDGGAFHLDALLATPDGRQVARGRAAGEDPEVVTNTAIAALREAGADAVLAALRS